MPGVELTLGSDTGTAGVGVKVAVAVLVAVAVGVFVGVFVDVAVAGARTVILPLVVFDAGVPSLKRNPGCGVLPGST